MRVSLNSVHTNELAALLRYDNDKYDNILNNVYIKH